MALCTREVLSWLVVWFAQEREAEDLHQAERAPSCCRQVIKSASDKTKGEASRAAHMWVDPNQPATRTTRQHAAGIPPIGLPLPCAAAGQPCHRAEAMSHSGCLRHRKLKQHPPCLTRQDCTKRRVPATLARTLSGEMVCPPEKAVCKASTENVAPGWQRQGPTNQLAGYVLSHDILEEGTGPGKRLRVGWTGAASGAWNPLWLFMVEQMSFETFRALAVSDFVAGLGDSALTFVPQKPSNRAEVHQRAAMHETQSRPGFARSWNRYYCAGLHQHPLHNQLCHCIIPGSGTADEKQREDKEDAVQQINAR